MMDPDVYFELRWTISGMSDESIQRLLKDWRKSQWDARKANDYSTWREAIAWIEVLNDEIEFRTTPQEIADDVDEIPE